MMCQHTLWSASLGHHDAEHVLDSRVIATVGRKLRGEGK